MAFAVLAASAQTVPVALTITNDSLTAEGHVLTADVFIAQSTAANIALSIAYDAAALVPDSEISVAATADFATIIADDRADGLLTIALTPLNGTAANGKVATLKFIVIDNVQGKGEGKTQFQPKVSASAKTAQNVANISPTSVCSNGILCLAANEGELQRMVLYDISGVLLQTQNLSGTTANVLLPTLTAGVYILKVQTDKGLLTQRITVVY